MTTKHTPGPWTSDEHEHDEPYQPIRIRAAGRTLCKIWLDDAPVHDFNAEQRANARLIAAAPEMLNALHKAEQQLDYGQFDAAQDVLRAAIAKAEGRGE